jgi:uncharacterized membrane-anchored protein YhcB (DUF1043 family)
VREWEITKDELNDYYRQIVETLTNPSEILTTGLECRNCPAMAFCPAARKAAMNIIEASERVFIEDIDNDSLSFEMDQFKRAAEMLKQIEKSYNDLAIYRLREGQKIPNYSLENELTNRVWQESVTPESIEMLTGKDLTKKQLITPAQAEKAGLSKETVAALTTRHNKGVKLTRVDINKKAMKVFN